MRFERVFLCIPPILGVHGWPSFPHPGVGYLEEYLERSGIKVDILDMRLGYSIKDLIKKIKRMDPDLVGVSLVSLGYKLSYKLIREIKEAGYKVVVGGPHVSVFKTKVFEDSLADFAIKGEGEFPLLELCLGKPLTKIKNLIFRKGEKVIENENRPFIKELDKLPFPRYKNFELEKYREQVIPIVSSRGCPYQCTFCAVKVVSGRMFRARSAENVVSEMEYWYNKGFNKFDFVDDNFTVNKERIHQIIDLIEERGMNDLILNCGNGIRADRVDKNLLKRMREIGFRTLSFGVESANEHVLKKIKKGETLEEIENSIKMACELGFNVVLFFIVGLPGETFESFNNSVDFALKYPIDNVAFYNLIPFPGTEIFNWAKKKGYLLDKPENYLNYVNKWEATPLLDTPGFSIEEKRKALKLGRKIRFKVYRRNLSKNLKEKYGPIGYLFVPFFYFQPIRRITLKLLERKGIQKLRRFLFGK